MKDFQKLGKEMERSYQASEITTFGKELALPDRKEVLAIVEDVRKLFFPAYFDKREVASSPCELAEHLLEQIDKKVKKQVSLALAFNRKSENIAKESEEIADRFVSALPRIHALLLKDVEATFEGDPAAQSKEEIIFSYPGFFAISVYRIAHLLYLEKVPFVPRMMSEYAHSETGIDINPGATIGEYFFIDHGTGIVIGETTEIGDHVKIYQGVTLGALSPRKGQTLSGKKRHPTVCRNVTIYSGASILGGETVIGENAVIGGNSFITESVEPNAKVSVKPPELIIK